MSTREKQPTAAQKALGDFASAISRARELHGRETP